MVLKIDRPIGGSFFFLSSPLELPAIRLEGILLLTPSLVGLLLQYIRGAFDLSPKAEPDQMERPGRAFDLAVLPVLSDPEPLEQCSNGSAPGADPSERTEPELISDLLSNRRLDDFVRQKQGFLRQVLLCLVVCFHFGLAQFSQLLSSFATVVSPTKRKAASDSHARFTCTHYNTHALAHYTLTVYLQLLYFLFLS